MVFLSMRGFDTQVVLEAAPNRAASFDTTHWSAVVDAQAGDSSIAGQGLERLCRFYWWPLYAFVRRRGYGPYDAQDLTQEFFTLLLAKDFLRGVDRNKGKFRSFLLAAMQHFLAKEWRWAHAQKRGGGVTFVSIDGAAAEDQYLEIPAATVAPERLFEQEWATTLLHQTLGRLREEFARAGKETLFEELKFCLTAEKPPESYAELGVKLGMTEPAVKMAVCRMRKRYLELLRAEVASTVIRPGDIDEELRVVMGALTG